MSDSGNSDGSDRESSSPAPSPVPYVFYRDRPEWEDVEPVPQDDGSNPVVSIAYSDKFSDVYNYMRAMWKADERSERAFLLTEDAIECNPANYTVWHYRRQLLRTLGKDLQEEMIFTSRKIMKQPKNYQVWYHRQKVVQWSGNCSQELQLTAAVLAVDAKNYHAWQHRQWVIKDRCGRDRSFDFTLTSSPSRQCRGSRADNILTNNTPSSKYSLDYIRKAPNNESPWNYLQGILKDHRLSEYGDVWASCEELLASHIRSPYLLCLLVHIYQELGDTVHLSKALELCELLAKEADVIRKQYWHYLASKIKAEINTPTHS